MESLLTCVVNVKNGEAYLKHTLSSLTAQRAPIQVLVVDNMSTDGSDGIARTHENVRLVSTGSPLLLGEARNFSLDHVTSKYVAWLDSDNLWDPLFSAAYYRAFELFPDAALFTSDCTIIDSAGKPLPLYMQRLKSAAYDHSHPTYTAGEKIEELWTRLRHKCSWTSYVFLRSAVVAAGGFNSSFHYAEDMDIIAKVLERGRSIHVRGNLSCVRVHPQQVTRSFPREKKYAEVERVLMESGQRTGTLTTERVLWLQAIIQFRISTGGHSKISEIVRNLLSPSVLRWCFRRLMATERPRRMAFLLRAGWARSRTMLLSGG